HANAGGRWTHYPNAPLHLSAGNGRAGLAFLGCSVFDIHRGGGRHCHTGRHVVPAFHARRRCSVASPILLTLCWRACWPASPCCSSSRRRPRVLSSPFPAVFHVSFPPPVGRSARVAGC